MKWWNKVENTLWIGWPLVALVWVICFRLLMKRICGSDFDIDKYLPFILQVIGACLVLSSINSSIVTLSKTTIKELFFKDFERVRRIWRPQPIYGYGSFVDPSNTLSGTGENEGDFALFENLTTEQKLIFLKDKVHKLNYLIIEELNKAREDFRKELHSTNNDVNSVSQKVEDTESNLTDYIQGGVKGQIGGVLLGLYGAWLTI